MSRGMILAVCLLVLAGCAHGPLASVSAPIRAPIIGTVNIGSKQEFVPITKVILVPCDPPSQFLASYPSLAPLAGERMSENQMLRIWASDMAAYADLRADHNALAKWVKDQCQPK